MTVWTRLAWARMAFAAAVLLAASCDQKPASPEPKPTPVAAPAPHSSAPAMWTVGDADTKIYLFGTVHVLPPTVDWGRPRVEAAMKQAKAVYFETDINPDPAALAKSVQKLGVYSPGESLSDHLAPDQRKQLADASAKLSVPMFVLENQKPWLAAMTLSQEVISRAGYDPNSGVERSLEPMAKADGKEIRKLETVDEQLLSFADLPEKTQVAYLMEGLGEMDTEQTELTDLVSAWSHGDVDKLEKIMIEDDLGDMPDVYAALLVNRNKAWAEKLDELIKTEPGTFFVAVGAGHLAGKDSVLKQLAAKGYQATRVD